MKKLLGILLLFILLCAFGSLAYSQELQIATFSYSSATDGFTLNKGEGDRIATFEVAFPKPFEVKPEVFLCLNTIDAEKSANLRVSMKTMSISRDGFIIQIRTWSDSKINGVGGTWIALAPKK